MPALVPIHIACGDRVLRPNGRWTIRHLEEVVGESRSYATRTTRLLVLVPELSADQLDVRQLKELLDEYAPGCNIEVQIIHHGRKELAPHIWFCNPNERAAYQLQITIISSESMAGYKEASLTPFDEVLACVGVRYTGLDSVHPGESVEIKQILTRGGHLAPSLHVDLGMFPYTDALVHFTVHGALDQVVYPIKRPQHN